MRARMSEKARTASCSEGPAEAGLFGIHTPNCLLHAFLFMGIHQKILQILDDDFADVAHLTGGKQLACMPYHGMPGVIVSQGKNQPGIFNESDEFLSLFERYEHFISARKMHIA